MTWYGWFEDQSEANRPLDYREPRPDDYVTRPQESASSASYSPEDYSASNDDWASFIEEVKSKMTDTDDALVEWAEATEGFKSAVSRRRAS